MAGFHDDDDDDHDEDEGHRTLADAENARPTSRPPSSHVSPSQKVGKRYPKPDYQSMTEEQIDSWTGYMAAALQGILGQPEMVRTHYPVHDAAEYADQALAEQFKRFGSK